MARQARAEALRDWLWIAGQRVARYGARVAAPATLIGSSLGMACFRWLNDRRFARAVNLLLIAASLGFLL